MIIGHDKITSFLDKSLKKGNLNHAYLFSGPEHVGRFTVALNFAEKILGDVKEANPDLLIVRPEIEEKKGIIKKKAINIETIREMQRKASIAPSKGKYKIIIIDDADYLNIASQNALLKTLEEPPRKVILILIAKNQQKLLPTIISRCQIKRFNLISEQELKDIPGANDEIVFWSMGRSGLAMNYAKNGDELEKVRQNLDDMKKIISSGVSERFALAESWSKDSPELMEKLSLWMFIARQTIVSEKNIITLPKDKCFRIIEKIGESMEIMKTTNANTRLILENLLLEF